MDSKCRLCTQHDETIARLTSGRPILKKKKYLMGHYKVCARFALLKMPDPSHRNDRKLVYTHKPVCDN